MTSLALERESVRLEGRWLLAGLLAIVLFIPMRRYTIPVNLPFNLEPYRIFVGLLFAFWILALLVRQAFVRRTWIDGPILLFIGVSLASVAANGQRVAAHQAEVTKVVTLLVSFVIVFYLIVSLVRTQRDIEFLTVVLVFGGAIVAVFALIESRTGWTPFVGMQRYLPFLRAIGGVDDGALTRGVRFRAFGSAEHPIALGALLVMIVPLSIALAARRSVLWWVATFVLVVGAVSTVSRTPVLMLVVMGIVFVITRWNDARRYWLLVFPMIAVIHFASPGTLGTLRSAFQPSGGLIAEQSSLADSQLSSGRVADIGPTLDEASRKPLIGYGPGTRIVDGPEANARILDNQWLGTLLDVGVVGLIAIAWVFARFVRRMTRLARSDQTTDGYVAFSSAAAIAAFAVGMFTYDAFAFTQVTLVAFVILGLGVSHSLLEEGREAVSTRSGYLASPVSSAVPR